MKTHLLTKKRALISSVAMLLVAIIALGTATFAWFTSNTTARATGINVRTQKVSELEISSKLKPNYAFVSVAALPVTVRVISSRISPELAFLQSGS